MLNGVLGCHVPFSGGMMSESEPMDSKLQQVKPDLRLLEADKGLEDVAPYVLPSFKLRAAQLIASAAAGLSRGGGRRQRRNFSKRVL